MAAVKPITLVIERGSQSATFQLEEGRDFLIGSHSSCQYSFPGISPKHVQILWDGKRISLYDMDSAEGTYRMPQGAPFAELVSDEDGEIGLRLGEEKIILRWSGLAEASIAGPKEKRARPAEVATTPGKAETKKKPSKTIIKVEVPQEVAAAKEPARPRVAEKPARPIELSVASRLRAFENLSLLFLLAFIFRILSELRQRLTDWQLWEVPQVYRRGIALDYLYLYTHDPFFVRTIVVGAAGLVFSLVFMKPIGRYLANRFGAFLSTRVLFLFSGMPGARFIGALCSLLLLIWTPLLAFSYGLRPADLQILTKVDDYLGGRRPHIDLQVDNIGKDFMGSSLLYKAWVLSEREDLLSRCRGFGLDSWNGQRSCSVLFFSKTLEGYARFQPRISQELAASQVVLASLDGLIRIFSLEGPGSPVLDLFLDPLETVGLGAERREITDFIASFQGLELEKMLQGLANMRHRSEDISADAQARVPKSFLVRFPGPLELGI